MAAANKNPAGILILSPYHGGSHAAWAEGFREHSRHQVKISAMPARFWKWRMHSAAVTLARRFNTAPERPDVLVATDMLDLTTFLALTRRHTAHTPVILYMHENQLTYPLPEDGSTGPMRRQLGERDRHYAFVNLTSMLVADEVWFNSRYHQESFFAELPGFLRHFPDYRELGQIEAVRRKSRVMPVGIDFGRLAPGGDPLLHEAEPASNPLILWNQRWEYDKNPAAFFAALDTLADRGLPFRVALCGQQFGQQPQAFTDGIEALGERIVHQGFASPEVYAGLLAAADIVVSTAHHEFFGISILEAIFAGAFPLLPRRLSYPELLPESFHDQCLYVDQAALVDKLAQAVSQPQERRGVAQALAADITRFGWPQLVEDYDTALAEIAISGR